MKEDKARTSTPKPPEIKKRKTAEPSDESDSQDQPALRPENSVGIEESQRVGTDLAAESNDIDMGTQTSTGIVEQQLDPIHLRREEEESTQDLMAEHLNQQRSVALVPEVINDTGDLPAIQIDSQPISEAILDTGVQNCDAGNNEKSDGFLDEIPSVCIIFVSYQNSDACFQNIVENRSQASLAGEGLTSQRSQSRSVSSQQNKNEESDIEAVIPPTASTHRESLQALSQPAVAQVNIFQASISTHHLPTRQRVRKTLTTWGLQCTCSTPSRKKFQGWRISSLLNNEGIRI